MQIGELAKRLGVPYRMVRYILEQGILPSGVDAKPGRGEHRDLDSEQTFWVAVVLVLKQNGLNAPLAGHLAEYLYLQLEALAREHAPLGGYNPFQGQVETGEIEVFVELADLTHARVLWKRPGKEDLVTEWLEVAEGPQIIRCSDPLVVLRLDLTTLGELLSRPLP